MSHRNSLSLQLSEPVPVLIPSVVTSLQDPLFRQTFLDQPPYNLDKGVVDLLKLWAHKKNFPLTIRV